MAAPHLYSRPIDIFDTPEAAVAMAAQIVAEADSCGMLSGGSLQSEEAHRVARQAEGWLNAIGPRLDRMTPGEALSLLTPYDLMHRLARRTAAPTRLLDRYRLAAFEARLHGDRTVDEYLLFRTIDAEIRRRNPAFLGKPLQWHSLSLDRWWRQFRYGVSLQPLSDYDTANRVSILLSADLSVYTSNPAQFKTLLLANHPQLNTAFKTNNTDRL